ncbi:response regulator [Telmatospirillum sp. J64-1]|uniref:response regulator n=1 Tax=Telmatospirillum sp. J64-1 TaxID=2502183 RepID=UPI00115F1B00|nr:response regulator [Telmatospirillum sp. J64-1]
MADDVMSGARVLVVEDDEMQRMALEMLLQAWGSAPVMAATAQEAEDAAAKDAPMVILSDFRLPSGRSGLDLVLQLRQRAAVEIPAILLTGDTATDLARQAEEANCVLINKPCDPNTLRTTILRLLSR